MPPWIFAWLVGENKELQEAIGWASAIFMALLPIVSGFGIHYLYNGFPHGDMSGIVWFVWVSTIPPSLYAIFKIFQRIFYHNGKEEQQ